MSETPRIIIHSQGQKSSQNGSFNFPEEAMRLPSSSEYLRSYRKHAWESYHHLSFPARTDEAWRRTKLTGLDAGKYKLSFARHNLNGGNHIPDMEVPTGEDLAGTIYQSNDRTSIKFDEKYLPEGVVFCDLVTAEEKYSNLLEMVMGRVVDTDESIFSALTASFAQYGCLLYIPRGVNIESPFQYHIHGNRNNDAYLSHVMVYLEEGASATLIVEEDSAKEQDAGFSANITEIFARDNAHLDFVKIQNWSENTWNFSHEKARVARDGSVRWITGALGSRLTKSFITVDLIEQGSSGTMYGFYIPDGSQHFDYDTQQNHLAPHTQSDLMYKGALLGKSRAVWQGMIYVSPTAMKTDGYQLNRNLVLSENARVDTIPGLEILANDVRCSHGATVGKIDKEQLFYLLSRGIPSKEAEKLLVDGFFEPILSRVPEGIVRNRVKGMIDQKLGYQETI